MRVHETTLCMHTRDRIQTEQYAFPYHHIVDLEEASFSRTLDFGLDYFTYMRRVLELVRKYVMDDVLDIGCGDGFLLCQIASDPTLSSRVRGTGIDLDERAIAFAGAFSHGMSNVAFEARDVATFERSSGLITLVETLEHIPDDALSGFLTHVDRLLVPGGTLIASVPTTVRPLLPKHHRHYDLGSLLEHFPSYRLLEVSYVTARNSLLYQLIARLLTRSSGVFRRRVVRDALLWVHERYTSDVSPEQGAHLVAALRKPGS